MVHWNQSDNHCNRSDTQSSVLLLANTPQLPSLSRTHMHAHTHTHTLTHMHMACLYTHTQTHHIPYSAALSLAFLAHIWELVKQNNSCLTCCWFFLRYMLILTSKIMEITSLRKPCSFGGQSSAFKACVRLRPMSYNSSWCSVIRTFWNSK